MQRNARQKLPMKFKKEYYQTNNYKDYLDREQRYEKLATEIDTFFKTIGIDLENKKILDYGCAVGFLINGFKKLNYKNVQGVEISKWAASVCLKKGFEIVKSQKITNQNLVIFLDVLEHIEEKRVDEILTNLETDFILVRIPVCSVDNGKFVLEISEKDETHINRKSKETWVKVFKKNGFDFFCYLNLNTIYDSEGVFCALFKKSTSNRI